MRIIGIDPGLTRCGIGLIEGAIGNKPRFLAAGVVRTSTSQGLADRLLQLENGLCQWFDEYAPEAVAVERVFAQQNLHSITDTAQAAGTALLLAARRGLPSTSYTPSEVKAAVSGSGRADKAQVTSMVTKILKLQVAPRPADAADAVALAICHLWRGGATNRYAAALSAARRNQ